jgi:hypothetical protein
MGISVSDENPDRHAQYRDKKHQKRRYGMRLSGRSLKSIILDTYRRKVDAPRETPRIRNRKRYRPTTRGGCVYSRYDNAD